MFCSNGRIGCKYCRDAKSLGPLTHTGVALSKLWSNAEIGDGGNNKSSTRLNSLGLRNKIHKHVSSAAHLLPCKTRESKEQKGLEEELEAQTVKVEHITECVFSHSKTQPAIHWSRDAGWLTSYSNWMESIWVWSYTLSHYTATNIVNHIAGEMRKKVNNVSCSAKLFVLIDESTILSHLSVMIVYIKAAINNSYPVFIFFLDLVELESQTAECITSQLINCLKDAGFPEEFLQKHWILLYKWRCERLALLTSGNVSRCFSLALRESSSGDSRGRRSKTSDHYQPFQALSGQYLQFV